MSLSNNAAAPAFETLTDDSLDEVVGGYRYGCGSYRPRHCGGYRPSHCESYDYYGHNQRYEGDKGKGHGKQEYKETKRHYNHHNDYGRWWGGC